MNYKHGFTEKAKRTTDNSEWRAHHCWMRMRNRCDNRKSPDYKNYGGRGITYDPRWSDFSAFVADMGLPPPNRSLDRIDNNGPYCKENCRWADRLTQSRNRRNAHLIAFQGKSMRIAEWAEYLGVPITTIKNRIYRGWPLERALTATSYEEVGRFKPKGEKE
jgi:hypothetical protein